MPKNAEQVRKESRPDQKVSAFFRPETVDRENRTVEVVFTTGEAGERYDWWDEVRYLESLEISESAIRAALVSR